LVVAVFYVSLFSLGFSQLNLTSSLKIFAMSLMPSLKAQSLAKLFLQNPSTDGSNVMGIAWQMDHRLDLISFWGISPGSRVLEIGCGQGDCTVVLADAVGESGHVDAVDPGAPDYGRLFS
jgi:predicted methyltransferase